MEFEKIPTKNKEGLIEELSDEELTACVGGTGYVKTNNGKSVNTQNKSDDWIEKKEDKGQVEYDANGSWRAWGYYSDRNMKENFSPVDAQEILAKIVNLPISSWNYKEQDAQIRHIGPMAQDFSAAFAVGESDRMINMIDANGVALAAIQALYQKLREKDAQIEAMRADIENMKQQKDESKIYVSAARPVAVFSGN